MRWGSSIITVRPFTEKSIWRSMQADESMMPNCHDIELTSDNLDVRLPLRRGCLLLLSALFHDWLSRHYRCNRIGPIPCNRTPFIILAAHCRSDRFTLLMLSSSSFSEKNTTWINEVDSMRIYSSQTNLRALFISINDILAL